ncbi:MAG: SHOCT domain-containing protein [Chlorobiaceae bacterium]
MMYGYGVSHGFGLVGGIFSLIFWFLIIWLIVGLVRGGHHHSKGCCGGHGDEKRPDSATEILRQRFAKGEISKEEFESRTAVLEGKKLER